MDILTYGMAKSYADGAITQALSSVYKFIGQCTNAQLISKTRTNGNVWAIYGDIYNVNTSDTSQSALTAAYIAAGGPAIPIAGDELRNVYNSKVYEYDTANGWITQTTWTTSAVGSFHNGSQVAYSDTSLAWIELKSQMHVNVINSLTSTSTVDALAAAAGKTLNDSKQQNTIIGTTAPTTATVGTLGQSYVDTTEATLYKCTAISGSTYTWTAIGSGSQRSSPIWIQDMAPDTGSVGETGDIILCRNDGKVYECTGGSAGAYQWSAMIIPNTENYYQFLTTTEKTKIAGMPLTATGSVSGTLECDRAYFVNIPYSSSAYVFNLPAVTDTTVLHKIIVMFHPVGTNIQFKTADNIILTPSGTTTLESMKYYMATLVYAPTIDVFTYTIGWMWTLKIEEYVVSS